jgi:hypothetical protein
MVEPQRRRLHHDDAAVLCRQLFTIHLRTMTSPACSTTSIKDASGTNCKSERADGGRTSTAVLRWAGRTPRLHGPSEQTGTLTVQ